MSLREQWSIWVAGLALFSMFFGAGDLIWPFILGGMAGDQNLYAFTGLLISGVFLPLVGLFAMLLYRGDYNAFFKRLGKIPSLLLIFLIQAILGPIGSIPRLLTLSYSTLEPYFPISLSLIAFSFLASLFVLVCTHKKHRIVELLGIILTPILLVCLGFILFLGFKNPPEPQSFNMSQQEAFSLGLGVGYNTLDLIASFIFAPFVLSHFCLQHDDSDQGKQPIKKMAYASLIAAALLSIMYLGLTFLASYYTPTLNPDLPPEARLTALASLLLGPYGGFVASLSVCLACLTTSIPLVSIASDYIHETFLSSRVPHVIPQALVLIVSTAIATLGFTGIANMLQPLLHILCPILFVISLINIGAKILGVEAAETREEAA